MKTAETILNEFDSYFIAENIDQNKVVISYDDAVKAMNEFANQSRWISCAERLPESGQEVLIWQDLGSPLIGYYNPEHGCWYEYLDGRNPDVKFWQTIEPPKQ